MRSIKIPAGAEVFMGAPAEPMRPSLSAALGRAVSKVPSIVEAHLPQCYVPGSIAPPAQVLVIVTTPGGEDAALRGVESALAGILPEQLILDVWPLTPDHSLLPTVRAAGCQIAGPASSRSRWKFRR